MGWYSFIVAGYTVGCPRLNSKRSSIIDIITELFVEVGEAIAVQERPKCRKAESKWKVCF